MQREYAAFISYRHKPLDMAVATRLHKCIERFRVPKDLRKEEKKSPGTVFSGWEGVPSERMLVFRDREELPLSNDLTSDIFDALDHASCLIVVCTPDTPKSLWVRREISHFIEKHGRKRIVTVLAAGTPEESIPKEITARYAEDGVTILEEYEPLVAYLVAPTQREVMKKLDKELLRVCAALLGCPYDSLKQRHKRRKMQQALAAAGAAFLVALSFIGVLVNRNMEILAQKQEVENQKLQVEAQKQEAEAQRRMVQLRESELLAADARAALEAGDTRLAIEKAVSALPKEGEEDRPYYAPAESVLMEAMDVMGGTEEHVILANTVLEQMTPIYNMDISSDGSVVVTVDKYGVLHGFDAVSGCELWMDIIAAESAFASTGYVRISGDDSCLVCLYGETMEGRDPHSGELLWRYDMYLAVDGYFIYDDQRNRIAVLKYYDSAEKGMEILEMEIISAETGAVEQTIALESQEDFPGQTIHDSYQGRLSDGGVFSGDGRYFACAFPREHGNEEKTQLMCFVVDLQEGTLVRKYEKEIPYSDFNLSGMRFYEDGLVMVLEPYDDTVAGIILKLDWQNGRLLWQTTTPAELEDVLVAGGRSAHVIMADSVVVLGKYDKVYAIDPQTGEIVHSASFPGSLSSMHPASDYYFAFALEDGTYAIAWYSAKNGFDLTTDSFYNIWVPVGEHKLLEIQGGGILQYYSDGNYAEVSVSNVEKPGCAAVVSDENANQIIIKRPITLEKTVVSSAVKVPLDTNRVFWWDADCVELDDNMMVMGQLRYDDKDGNTHVTYLVMDAATKEIKKQIEVTDVYDEMYYFLSDGSGYVNVSQGKSAKLVRDGVEKDLTPQGEEMAEADYSTSIRYDSAYLSDGTILTVCGNDENLTIFKDGVQTVSAAMPDSDKNSEDQGLYRNRYLRAGRNGYVVTYVNSSLYSDPTTDLAFYDTTGNTWLRLELAVPLMNIDAYTFAEKAPLFAAVDVENQVRVWNLQAGGEAVAFPLQLPYNSVEYMGFLLDDSCLMVKTQDAKVLVYEIATGQILLQDQLDTSFDGKLTAKEDPESQRLYIIDTYVNGLNALCIDLRSWTVLARAEDVLCYVPQTNELYYEDGSYYTDDPKFLSFPVPDTAALVRMGQQMLENG